MKDHSSGKFPFHFHSGISSILLIFIILSLISFAILSYSSANADWKLTNKVLTRTTSYYQACNRAQEELERIDQQLSSAYQQAQLVKGTPDQRRISYFQKSGKQTAFSEKITENQQLAVSLTYLYPDSPDGPFYRIDSWEVKTDTDHMQYNESLPLPK